MTEPIDQQAIDKKYEKFARAMFLESQPVNPNAFETALSDYLADGGEPTSETFRAILWTLLSMHYGQFRVINLAHATYSAFRSTALSLAALAYPAQEELNMHDEYMRLDEVFNGEPVEDEDEE